MKFLKFLLIIAIIFIYANWETYGPRINTQIDRFVPQSIQDLSSEIFDKAEAVYLSVTNGIDVVRGNIKAWSLLRSERLVSDAGIEEPKTNTFSPILSNFSRIISSELSIVSKSIALLLIPLTLVTWNRTVTLVIIAYILYKALKTLFSKVKQKRKKTFFDRIGENIPKDEYDSDKAKW